MYKRIRKAREDAGYTREKFAEVLDVSVSYMAEVERGRTGVSVKTLMNICNLLGLSADYILFGKENDDPAHLIDKINRLDQKYIPLIHNLLNELLSLSQ